MSLDEESVSMARRALLTDHERDALLDRESNDARYVAVSRVRKKIDEELTDDVEVLRHHDEEHDTDLLGNLQDVVCGDESEEDIAESDSSEQVVETGLEETRTDTEAKEKVYGGLKPVSRALEAVEFPSTKPRDDCIEAVRAAYEYLQREGAATKKDFVRDVMPDHPVGYDVPELEPGERYRGAWWRKVVKPGLEALPDVESPPSGGSDWTLVEAQDA